MTSTSLAYSRIVKLASVASLVDRMRITDALEESIQGMMASSDVTLLHQLQKEVHHHNLIKVRLIVSGGFFVTLCFKPKGRVGSY